MVVSEFVQSIRPLMAKFAIDVPDIRIHGLTLDSRNASKHMAFVAVKGYSQDGRNYIPQAIELGTPVVFSQTEDKTTHGKVVTQGNTLIVSLFDLPAILSSIAGAFYDYPANKLITTGVTGTNGKTSTVNLLSQSKLLLGNRPAAIGTLGSGVYEGGETSWIATDNANTTPDAINMQYRVAEFVQQGVTHLAYEASSHALVQNRIAQINTNVAVFTNLSRDHLDYHRDMDDYAAAKRNLLNQPGLQAAVINIDDSYSADWAKDIGQKQLKGVAIGVGTDIATISPEFSHCIASNITYHCDGCEFTLQSTWGNAVIRSGLMGEFNLYNLLSTLGVLLVQGERFDDVVAMIPKLKPVPGRMEVFEFRNRANVVIDYAHTPDALDKALIALSQHGQAKPWCIFGCGGDRDKGKRPEMAKVAQAHSSNIVITTDNSRTEAPEEIEQHIRHGFTHPDIGVSKPNRKEAIQYCLDKANKDDLILLAGKGHETYQIIDNNYINYDERAYVMQLQKELAQ